MKNILKTLVYFLLLLSTVVKADNLEINKTYSGTFNINSTCEGIQTLRFLNVSNTDLLTIKVNTHGFNSIKSSNAETVDSPLLFSVKNANDEILVTIWESLGQAKIASQGGDLNIMVETGVCQDNDITLNYDVVIEATKAPVSVTGLVTTSAKVPVANAEVSFYLPTGEWVAGTRTNPLGQYTISTAPDAYLVEAINSTGNSVYSTNEPKDVTGRELIKQGTKLNIILDNTKPSITSIIPATFMVSGVQKAGYTITGANFGALKGYVDIGGYLTNSATYIRSWTDTQIDLVKTTTMPTTGCLKVFSKYSGYSDCLIY